MLRSYNHVMHALTPPPPPLHWLPALHTVFVCALLCVTVTGVQPKLGMSDANTACAHTPTYIFAWSLSVAVPRSRLEQSV